MLRCRIIATNENGETILDSNFVQVIEPVQEPATAPAQVPSLTATPGEGFIDLTWDTPHDGGSPITDYQIEVTTDGTTWSVITDDVSTEQTYTDTNVTDDIEHTYRVSAINAVGTGDPSEPASATPIAASSSRLTVVDELDANGALVNAWFHRDLSAVDGELIASVPSYSGGTALTAPTDEERPTYRADGLEFTGAHSLAVPMTQAQPFFVIAWIKFTADSTNNGFLGWDGSVFRRDQGGLLRIYSGQTLLSTAETTLLDQWHSVSGLVNGSSSQLSVDGGTPDTGDAGGNGITTTFYVGKNPSGAQRAHAVIRGILVLNRAPTQAEFDNLHALDLSDTSEQPAAPVNTVAPSISPTSGTVGTTFTGDDGEWTGTPAPTFTREWLNAGTPISGATEQTYKPAEPIADLAYRVTATNSADTATATSTSVVVSEAAPATIEWTTPSAISTFSVTPVQAASGSSAYGANENASPAFGELTGGLDTQEVKVFIAWDGSSVKDISLAFGADTVSTMPFSSGVLEIREAGATEWTSVHSILKSNSRYKQYGERANPWVADFKATLSQARDIEIRSAAVPIYTTINGTKIREILGTSSIYVANFAAGYPPTMRWLPECVVDGADEHGPAVGYLVGPNQTTNDREWKGAEVQHTQQARIGRWGTRIKMGPHDVPGTNQTTFTYQSPYTDPRREADFEAVCRKRNGVWERRVDLAVHCPSVLGEGGSSYSRKIQVDLPANAKTEPLLYEILHNADSIEWYMGGQIAGRYVQGVGFDETIQTFNPTVQDDNVAYDADYVAANGKHHNYRDANWSLGEIQLHTQQWMDHKMHAWLGLLDVRADMGIMRQYSVHLDAFDENTIAMGLPGGGNWSISGASIVISKIPMADKGFKPTSFQWTADGSTWNTIATRTTGTYNVGLTGGETVRLRPVATSPGDGVSVRGEVDLSAYGLGDSFVITVGQGGDTYIASGLTNTVGSLVSGTVGGVAPDQAFGTTYQDGVRFRLTGGVQAWELSQVQLSLGTTGTWLTVTWDAGEGRYKGTSSSFRTYLEARVNENVTIHVRPVP